MQSTRTICVQMSTHAVFFSSTPLCTHAKEQLVHECLHKMYLRVFFEQEVLLVLAELNAVEIARIMCAFITTHDFHSSSNRAVLLVRTKNNKNAVKSDVKIGHI